MQIQSLEKDLNVKLFDRLGKKIYLTEQGEIFRMYAEQIINLVQAAKEHLHKTEDLSHGMLSLGASNFVGVYLLTKILKEFNNNYPNIQVDMKVTTSKHLVQKLEINEIELLVISDQVLVDEKSYTSTPFYQDELILVVPKGHSLLHKQNVQFSDLQNETILVKPETSATRIFIERKMKEQQLSLSKYMEISSSEGIKQGVIQGLGIAFISKLTVTHEIEAGLLVEVPLEKLRFNRNINYIHHKSKYLSPAARKFIELMEKASMNAYS